MDLFEQSAKEATRNSRPLAERMRPGSLEEFVGQEHLLGKGRLIRRAIEADRIFSMILWGPPGCGKTTLARLVAGQTRSHFVHFSAVLSGVREIRAVVKTARDQLALHRRKTILFVDEIHRFNKAQQDAFLHHVESGLITLIGATTENPSFEVIAPLMSRCRVVVLETLTGADISRIIESALNNDEHGLGRARLEIAADALQHLVRTSAGDARRALNSLEVAADLLKEEGEGKSADSKKGSRRITLKIVEAALQRKALAYDKSGEEHFNLISAFHKSLRGSDPDAALYWLVRMLEGGEDPLYIARRMVRFAAEDIGNADPDALQTALNGMEAYRFLGSPEGELALAQAALYLAAAPKSNRIYTAYKAVKKTVDDTGTLPVPLHIRNAPTPLMRSLGYGRGYQYAHDLEGAVDGQEYLPAAIQGKRFYVPTDRGYEAVIRKRLAEWRQARVRLKAGESDSAEDGEKEEVR
jgi:putative ATPase